MDLKSKSKKRIDKKYKFDFGKYNGFPIMDVIKRDPQYILWCADTIEWFDLDTELYDLAEEYNLNNNDNFVDHPNYDSYYDESDDSAHGLSGWIWSSTNNWEDW